jgi:hypothetical protein
VRITEILYIGWRGIVRTLQKIAVVGVITLICLPSFGFWFSNDEFIEKSKQFVYSGTGGGEQNALINYVLAMEQFDMDVYNQAERLIEKILNTGWSDNYRDAFTYMKLIQPMLGEIWKGNEKPYLMYPAYSRDFPPPDYETLRKMGKAVICQALLCDHMQKPDYAIPWLKHSMIFAQRICDPDASYESKDESLQVEKKVLHAYNMFLAKRALTPEQYTQIANDLAAIQTKETPLWQMLRSSLAFFEAFNQSMSELFDEDSGLGMFGPSKSDIRKMKKRMEKQGEEAEKYITELEGIMKQGYPATLRAEIKPPRGSLYSLLIEGNFRSTAVQEGITRAWNSLLIGRLQILAYRAKNGKLPPDLNALKEMGFTIPNDPFATGQQLKYIVSGNQAVLYSVGTDLMDNKAQIEYTERKGLESPGDFIIRF